MTEAEQAQQEIEDKFIAVYEKKLDQIREFFGKDGFNKLSKKQIIVMLKTPLRS